MWTNMSTFISQAHSEGLRLWDNSLGKLSRKLVLENLVGNNPRKQSWGNVDTLGGLGREYWKSFSGNLLENANWESLVENYLGELS